MADDDGFRRGAAIEWIGADHSEEGVIGVVTVGPRGTFITTDGDAADSDIVVSFDPVGAFCCSPRHIRAVCDDAATGDAADLERPIRLVLMADYGANPLWLRGRDGEGETDVDLDTFPLSADVKRSLRAWVRRFDALSQTAYEWPSTAVRQQWIDDGRALREPVQHELGPGYDVTHFDD